MLAVWHDHIYDRCLTERLPALLMMTVSLYACMSATGETNIGARVAGAAVVKRGVHFFGTEQNRFDGIVWCSEELQLVYCADEKQDVARKLYGVGGIYTKERVGVRRSEPAAKILYSNIPVCVTTKLRVRLSHD
jgi:hypothetical protein